MSGRCLGARRDRPDTYRLEAKEKTTSFDLSGLRFSFSFRKVFLCPFPDGGKGGLSLNFSFSFSRLELPANLNRARIARLVVPHEKPLAVPHVRPVVIYVTIHRSKTDVNNSAVGRQSDFINRQIMTACVSRNRFAHIFFISSNPVLVPIGSRYRTSTNTYNSQPASHIPPRAESTTGAGHPARWLRLWHWSILRLHRIGNFLFELRVVGPD